MTIIFFEILPVVLTFFAGFTLKKTKALSSRDGDTLLKIVFYLGIPSLVLTSIPQINIDSGLIFLPLTAVLVLIISGAAALGSAFVFKRPKKESVTGVVGAMIMNLGLVFPFIDAFYGREGLAKALVFDMGNAFFTFTVTFYIANRFGTFKNKNFSALNLLKSPPLLSIITALFLNFSGFELPQPVFSFFDFNAKLVFPMIMIGLGLKFHPSEKFSVFILFSILSRMAAGFAAAWIILFFTDFDQTTKHIVLLCAAGPVGFNTITFSVLTGLDNEFAASIVSYSLAAGIIGLPLVYFILEVL